ncbi:alpha-glucosidase [Thermococcus eurythermalis]|uniref:Alpha-glucosidase n=1 Tax=Thermococcus eurythermalis TaxID=1505907 RepID=A0A097QTP3_9EURY|nr:30S ribosomal protein S20 [Thermococcus eurythermalis]AIU69856.1 alpha-glucosidase [Thermococcus eurythermalis]
MKSEKILLETAEVLESTIERVERLSSLNEKEKARVKEALREAAKNLRELASQVENDNEELAEFFYKKAKELKVMSTDKNIEKEGKKNYLKAVSKTLLYSRSAKYDFKPGELAELKKVYRKYIFGMTSFFVLTGAYLNPFLAVTALILAIPIILSMLSLQRRGYTGLLLAYSAMPIPIIAGVMVLRYSLASLIDPQKVQEIAEALGKSTTFAQGYLTFLIILAAVELYLLGSALVGLYKHRHAFL